MPQLSSNLYVPPTPAEQSDFAAVVTQMMGGQCDFVLPDTLAASYPVRTFTDSVTTKSYCMDARAVAREVSDDLSPGGLLRVTRI